MNDLDRWVNLEGPEPEAIREILDASSEVPDMTPEQEARMDRRLHAAVAEDRRRWARRRTVKRALGWGLLAACFAGVVALGVWLAVKPDLVMARRLLPNVERSVPNQLGGAEGAAPSSSGSARPAVPRSPRVGPRSPDR